MSIFEELDPLIRQIHKELQTSIKDSFPTTIKEPIRYFLETPGKKIRPIFTLLSCEAVGGDLQKAVPAALGIELFHDFTLIHDDIMDQDDLRRGRPTIHKKWDEGTAILVGDALIGMAYVHMLECDSNHNTEVMRLFSEALIKVCEGQALDKEFESKTTVTPQDYLDMIFKKTGWLMMLSCQIGAILGNASSGQIEAMKNFGKYLGIGFQIQDDLLDFVADEEKLGKKVGSDFKMDKKTYITLKYYEHMANNPELLSQYPKHFSEFSSIENLKSALFELGIVGDTESTINNYFNRALSELNKVQPLNDDSRIYRVVRFLQDRQY